jgi:hypothetical protein
MGPPREVRALKRQSVHESWHSNSERPFLSLARHYPLGKKAVSDKPELAQRAGTDETSSPDP